MEADVGKYPRRSIEDHLEVARAHVMNLHPLLQDTLLCQMRAAEFVKFLVINKRRPLR